MSHKSKNPQSSAEGFKEKSNIRDSKDWDVRKQLVFAVCRMEEQAYLCQHSQLICVNFLRDIRNLRWLA
jgi:hypothetical protein